MRNDQNVKSKDGVFTKFLNFFNGKNNQNELASNSEYSRIIDTQDSILCISNDKVIECHNCEKGLDSIFSKKHHCRVCPKIYCNDCCKRNIQELKGINFLTIDDGIINQNKLCDACFTNYFKLKKTLNESTVNNTVNNIIYKENQKLITKRETIYSIYCKNINVYSNDCYNYMKLEKRREEEIRKNLDSQSESIIKNMISSALKLEGLYDKWNEKAYELIKNVISNVCPSTRDMNDSVNINDYVKIKIVDYPDHTYTKYINGFAFQKNVCSKKMRTRINDPKILLLEDCGKDLLTETLSKNSNKLQNEYIDIILKKLEKVNPDIILVSSNIPYIIQEKLAMNNKILVMKVKPKSMTRIARIIKSYIVPSTDLVDTQTILGNCKLFYIDKVENKRKLENKVCNLMVFEQYDSILGCTIILSGPNKLELQIIKNILRTLIISARDIHLQKIFLYFSFYSPKPIITETEIKNKSITNTKMNFTFDNQSKCSINPKYDKDYIDPFLCFQDGFDMSFVNIQPNIYFQKLTFVQEDKTRFENSNLIQKEIDSSKLIFKN